MPQSRRPLTEVLGPGPTPGRPAGRRSLDEVLASPEPAPEIAPWRRYGAMALRGLGTVVGGIGGGLAAGPLGVVAGGAAGGGLGEIGAEWLEGRDEWSPLEIATQTGLGAIPVKGAGLLINAAKGAGMGAAGNAAYTLNEQGIPQDSEQVGELAGSAVTGALWGGAGGAAGAGLMKYLGRKGDPSAGLRGLREEAAAAPPTGGVRGSSGGPVGRPEPAPSVDPWRPEPGPTTTRTDQIYGMDPERIARRAQPPQPAAPRPAGDDFALAGAQPGRLPLDEILGPLAPPPQAAADPMEAISRAINGSGDSSASMEALSRQRGMQSRGESFVVYDRAGQRRPLLGPDAVDYAAREGETFGVEGPGGFQKLDDRGGRAPAPSAGAVVPAAGDTGDPFGMQPGSATLDAPTGATGESEIDSLIGMLTGKPKTSATAAPSVRAVPRADGKGLDIVDDTGRVHATHVDPADAPALVGATNGTPAAATTAIDRARETGKPFFPAEVVSAIQKLKPKWEQTVAETGVDMREDPTTFLQRIFGEPNARKLMGTERKAVKAARARLGEDIPTGAPVAAAGTEPLSSPPAVQQGGFLDKLKAIVGDDRGAPAPTDADFRDFGDESGQISDALLRQLGISAGSGAAAGATAGVLSDDENRTKNILGATVIGMLAPTAAGKGGMAKLGQARYFGMLGSAGTQAVNVLGSMGSVGAKAIEEAATGNPARAKELLAQVFSTATGGRIKRAFTDAATAPDIEGGRWGSLKGPLGIPSRMMHALDEGVTESMERAGYSADEAKTALFTNEPKSQFGKWLATRPESANVLIPFAKTIINMTERGLEHTPGIGALPAVRGMRDATTGQATTRQAMGALAMLLGATMGADKFGAAAMGPAGLPLQFGARAKEAYDQRGDDFTNIIKSLAKQTGQSLPLPTGATAYDPSRWLASFIPGFVKDASQVDPAELKQSGIFDPAIAKIPLLNEALLDRKPRKAKARATAR